MPYEKILELVEAKQLNITTVNLAEITADFIKYMQEIENKLEPKILSDFIAVAAKLILIKSKALLPDLSLTDQEESEVKELQSRLILYKQFKVASDEIKKIWQKRTTSFSRPLFMNLNNSFYPPKNINTIDLLSALASLSIEIQQLISHRETMKINLVSLEEKMEELVNKLNRSPQQTLGKLVKNKSRTEMVVIFLAILHLIKKQTINVDKNQWINLA